MTFPALNENPKNPSNTIFDEDITRLEKRRTELEAERQKLLSGQISVAGTDHTSLMEIDLGVLSATAADQVTLERNLKQTLNENPLVLVLDNSFKKTRELREEMTQRGELPGRSKGKLSILKVIKANNRLNRKLAARNKLLGKTLASPWLIVIGLVILLIWCGGFLLFLFTAGLHGGKSVQPPVTAAPNLAPTHLIINSPSAGQTTNLSENTARLERVENVAFLPLASNKQIESSPSVTQEQETLTPKADIGAETRVGDPASQTGGFNGPHGAFLAPARLKIASLGIDTLVVRAITQNSGAAGNSSIVSWPRPGEVVHTGAYPGEIGNMLIMGNQEDLGGLRRIQQNDEITVYDRKGNTYIYRVVAFSPDGQTEREIDPTSLSDAWVFEPTDEAILTILVTYPQALPPLDPNQNGQSTSKVTAKNDYLTSRKLAYRAVLAMYAPATATPAGTPVAVPDEAWQTVGAPVTTTAPKVTPTPAPALTPAPTPEPTALPAKGQEAPTPTSMVPNGLPDTGLGGGFSPSKN
jgi:hypothetical protein